MAMTLKELYAEIRALPREQAAELMDLLVSDTFNAPDPAVEEAWAREVERRIAAFDGGKVQALPGDQVMGATAATDVIRRIESLPAPDQAKVRAWLETREVEESPEVLAALDAAVQSAAEHGTVPVEEVRKRLLQLCSAFDATHSSDRDPLLSRITIEPGTRSGKPCIRGTRITVYDVFSYLAGGTTEQELLRGFPSLTHDDILACYAYAAQVDRRTFRPPPA